MEASYRKAAETVAHDLMGTCQNLSFVLENHDMDGYDNNQDFCYILDSLVWECRQCGWWTEPCDVDDDDVCSGCRDYDNE